MSLHSGASKRRPGNAEVARRSQRTTAVSPGPRAMPRARSIPTACLAPATSGHDRWTPPPLSLQRSFIRLPDRTESIASLAIETLRSHDDIHRERRQPPTSPPEPGLGLIVDKPLRHYWNPVTQMPTELKAMLPQLSF